MNFGGAELGVGSAGWGNNRRRLLSVRCSQRKMTAGEILWPGSLAGAVGRLLVQEGRSDKALFWPGRTARGAACRQRAMAGKAVASAVQSSEERD
jgi:hypothetical protein